MNVIIIQPPMMQLNSPYPSGAYLSAFFKRLCSSSTSASNTSGKISWYDLSIELFHSVFSREGLSRIFTLSENKALSLADRAENAGDDGTAFNLRRYVSQAESWCSWIEPVKSILCGCCGSGREICHEFVRSAHVPRGQRMENYLSSLNRDVSADDAQFLAGLALADLSDYITAVFDENFALIRYAESLAAGDAPFDEIEKAADAPVMKEFYAPLVEKLISGLHAELCSTKQKTLFLISVPFAGVFSPALATCRIIRRIFADDAVISIGGGYVNTALRSVSDERIFSYTDYLSYDRGYAFYEALLGGSLKKETVPAATKLEVPVGAGLGFDAGSRILYMPPDESLKNEETLTRTLVPDYQDADFSKYLRVADDVNPMHRIWSDGAWMKAFLAYGCYWHRCAFCDTSLDYVRCYKPVETERLFSGLLAQAEAKGVYGIHFVDEAAPPVLLKKFALLNCAGGVFDDGGTSSAGGSAYESCLSDAGGSALSGDSQNESGSAFTGGSPNAGNFALSCGAANSSNSTFTGGSTTASNSALEGAPANSSCPAFTGGASNSSNFAFTGVSPNAGNSALSGGTSNSSNSTFTGGSTTSSCSALSCGSANSSNSALSGAPANSSLSAFTSSPYPRNARRLSFWGNIRFEKAFTRDMADILAYGGLTGVSGGIEIASESGLADVNKGINVENLVAACAAFKEAGILVHAYMIYGFYNETPQMLIDSAETLRQLYKAGLVDSSFWHKFTLTEHSEVFSKWKKGLCPDLNPEFPGDDAKDGRKPFAEYGLHFKGENRSEKYGQPLMLALEAWMHGESLDKPVQKWFPFAMPKPSVPPDFIDRAVTKYEKSRDAAFAEKVPPEASLRQDYYWLGGKPFVLSAAGGKAFQLCWSYMGELLYADFPGGTKREEAQLTADFLWSMNPKNHQRECGCKIPAVFGKIFRQIRGRGLAKGF